MGVPERIPCTPYAVKCNSSPFFSLQFLLRFVLLLLNISAFACKLCTCKLPVSAAN